MEVLASEGSSGQSLGRRRRRWLWIRELREASKITHTNTHSTRVQGKRGEETDAVEELTKKRGRRGDAVVWAMAARGGA